MADLKLSFAMTPRYGVGPIISGEVKPDGITLEYMGMPGKVSRVFYEQMKYHRYDVSEMSISSFLRMRSINWPYFMLPAFHNRQFSYAKINIRLSSGIRQGHPEDLKGKRMGLEDYQQSVGLWTRGILQMEFGIKPEDMIWYQERGKHFSHTGACADSGLTLPETLTLHHAKTDLNTMYARGELDASLNLLDGVKATLNRNRIALSGNLDMVTLFPDPRQEGIRFFKKTGVFPPHHTTVVRESIVKEHPWVAISLMEAFEESKRIAIERLRQSASKMMVFGDEYFKDLDDVFGPDPYPNGVKANAKALDMVQTFSVQQGLTKRKQPLDEIFPQEVIYREEPLP